ncbi:hypothetical protein Avbf_04674 [Armadillidium vulgare]|nr:hypothetical protein Avbf_04674 [Armadillidium vulgare]
MTSESVAMSICCSLSFRERLFKFNDSTKGFSTQRSVSISLGKYSVIELFISDKCCKTKCFISCLKEISFLSYPASSS